MKKALLLVVALAVSSAAFAQTPGLTIGTWGYAEGAFNTPVLFDIYNEAYVAYKARDMGLNSTITTSENWRAGAITGPAVDLQDLSIWYKPYSFLKALAGKLYESGDAVLSSYVDGKKFSTYMANMEPGIMGTLYPTRELTVSAFTPFDGSGIFATIAQSSFSAKYAIPKIATIVASYRFREYELAASIDFRLVSDLTLKAGFRSATVFKGSSLSQADLYLTIGKRFGDLNLGLDSEVIIQPGPGSFGIKGMAEYTLGLYTFGTKISFAAPSPYTVTSQYVWINEGFRPSVHVRRDFSAGSVQATFSYDPDDGFKLPMRFVIFF